MLREKLREYFSFTRKERIGVLVLIFLTVLIFIFPYYFELRTDKTDQGSLEEFKNEVAQLKIKPQNDSEKKADGENNATEENNISFYEPTQTDNSGKKNPLFYFDPNSLSETKWKQLGLRDKTIHTIQNYISKGGRFKVPEDLKKVYGIHEYDYDRLFPFIKIKNSRNDDDENVKDNIVKRDNPHAIKKTNDFLIVDINTADSADFDALRGIGSKLASRIIHFRERLGGFCAVDQIAEIYGLPDSVFQSIKPSLTIKNDSIHKIDINIADINILKQHPYIRWELARAIIQYRSQHGLFKKPEELLQIAIMTPENFRKIAPYVKN